MKEQKPQASNPKPKPPPAPRIRGLNAFEMFLALNQIKHTEENSIKTPPQSPSGCKPTIKRGRFDDDDNHLSPRKPRPQQQPFRL